MPPSRTSPRRSKPTVCVVPMDFDGSDDNSEEEDSPRPGRKLVRPKEYWATLSLSSVEEGRFSTPKVKKSSSVNKMVHVEDSGFVKNTVGWFSHTQFTCLTLAQMGLPFLTQYTPKVLVRSDYTTIQYLDNLGNALPKSAKTGYILFRTSACHADSKDISKGRFCPLMRFDIVISPERKAFFMERRAYGKGLKPIERFLRYQKRFVVENIEKKQHQKKKPSYVQNQKEIANYYFGRFLRNQMDYSEWDPTRDKSCLVERVRLEQGVCVELGVFRSGRPSPPTVRDQCDSEKSPDREDDDLYDKVSGDSIKRQRLEEEASEAEDEDSSESEHKELNKVEDKESSKGVHEDPGKAEDDISIESENQLGKEQSTDEMQQPSQENETGQMFEEIGQSQDVFSAEGVGLVIETDGTDRNEARDISPQIDTIDQGDELEVDEKWVESLENNLADQEPSMSDPRYLPNISIHDSDQPQDARSGSRNFDTSSRESQSFGLQADAGSFPALQPTQSSAISEEAPSNRSNGSLSALRSSASSAQAQLLRPAAAGEITTAVSNTQPSQSHSSATIMNGSSDRTTIRADISWNRTSSRPSQAQSLQNHDPDLVFSMTPPGSPDFAAVLTRWSV